MLRSVYLLHIRLYCHYCVAGGVVWRFDVVFYFLEFLSSENQYVCPTPPAPPPFFFGRMKLFFFTVTPWGWLGHMSKKKAPLTTVNFLVPVTGGHCGPNGKWACFFPVIFQSFESLSGLQPLFKVERIIDCSTAPAEYA